jgi:hypothetical protein
MHNKLQRTISFVVCIKDNSMNASVLYNSDNLSEQFDDSTMDILVCISIQEKENRRAKGNMLC